MPLLSRVKDIFKGGSLSKKKKVYHNVKLENPEEIWEIVSELGDGAYGKVYKAQKRFSGQFAALKLVPLEGEDDLDTFMVEIDILAEFRHPNIVALIEAYHYDGKLWMYLEYCNGGAVDSIMVDLDRPLTEPQIACICHALCQALDYVHCNRVIHRDLKAGNVLLTMDGGIKLADFGVSAKNKNTFDKRGTFIGTPYWLAPEVILCETFIDAKYDYKADIWSLGVCLIEFAQMEPPNHDVSPVRVMLKIQKSDPPKLDCPKRWSNEFNDFLSKCLTKDPELRPTAAELLKHPFLTKPLNLKPIRDLLLEFNAEVVEEVEEEGDDQDPCRINNFAEPFNKSNAETSSLISVDPSICDEKVQNSIENERSQITLAEKRLSKGPAPLPPISPKKTPAPAAPISSSPTLNDAINSPEVISNSVPKTIPTSISETDVKSTDSNTHSPVLSSEMNGVKNTDRLNDKFYEQDMSPSNNGSIVISIEGKETDNKCNQSENLEFTSNIEIANDNSLSSSLSVDSSYNDQKEIVTSQDHSLEKPSIGDSGNDDSGIAVYIDSSNGGTTIEINDSESIDQSQPNDGDSGKLGGLPNFNNVVQTADTANQIDVHHRPVQSDFTGASSDVIVASISDEGTVIVRTPTPTRLPPSSNRDSPVPEKLESLVTCSVSEGPKSIPHQLSEETGSVENVSPVPEFGTLISTEVSNDELLSPESGSGSVKTESLTEAEAQAVLLLEKAIGGACAELDLDLNTASSISDESEQIEPPIMPEDSTVENIQPVDLKGHKLDSSEVLIFSSSILGEEEAQHVETSINLEAERKSKNQKVENVDGETTSLVEVPAILDDHEESHVSVISVAQEGDDDRSVSIQETFPTEACLHESLVKVDEVPVSMTIDGTTVEDTDVDQIQDGTTVLDQAANNTQSISPVNSALISSTPNGRLENVIQEPERPSLPEAKVNNANSSPREEMDEIVFRNPGRRPPISSTDSTISSTKSKKDKELQESIALRKKTRKKTRKFVIDGVVVTTTTSKVIYGDDEEQGVLSSAHLARKQELRELKVIQRREQKQFQDLSAKANLARQEQEKKFEFERISLIKNYDTQLENLTRQQKQLVEKAEVKQEVELKMESKKVRSDQERELRGFRESLKQEWKLLKQEVELVPKDRRKEVLKVRKEKLEREQNEREKAFLDRLNDYHEMALKRLNDKHREHIALKERQFLEEKHQLLRARESATWDIEERQIQDRHQLAKEQLKDIYFLQRLQMTIRHNVELEQVRRFNQQKEDTLLKRQAEERRQLPKRIRQEMKTREKMFKEQMRISMSTLPPSHEQEKDQMKKFQEQEKIKYDKERKRAEMKHKRQMEELNATMEASIKELVHLQNEKGKLLTEHETYKLKSLDEEYHKELREWKANLTPRKQKLEVDFECQLREQEKFYGEFLERSLRMHSLHSSSSSLTTSHP